MEPALKRPSFAFAKRHGLIVTEDRGDHVAVACRPGVALDAVQETQRFVQRPVKIQSVTVQEFDALLQRTYEGQTGAAAGLMEGLESEEADLDTLTHALSENRDLLESSDDAPIIRFINGLLVEAIKENASDIHVESFENRLTVRFRVDGVLREVMSPPKMLAPRIVSRIKVMAKLDIAEKRLPQDGRITRAFGGRKVDVRVSTIPTGAHHERVVMRILDKQAERLDLEHLGLDAAQIKVLNRVIGKPIRLQSVTPQEFDALLSRTYEGQTTATASLMEGLNDDEANLDALAL
ncbi:MAG: Flp pilus assembly complex ATPase component TadA, partial [Hydrocarboniphaga effusa]|nr:Flp pilus assembly complex ATPase component TadA [Hydrocarboniphaga effusa]